MSNTPLPEPVRTPLPKGALMGMLAIMDEYARAHAAAVSAELRADNTRLQNEVVMPLRERVRVLEDALRKAADDMEGWGLYAPEYFREKHHFVGDVAAARAALGDKTPNARVQPP